MTSIDYWILDFKQNWKLYFSKKMNCITFIVSILFFFVVSLIFKYNLNDIQYIAGVKVEDYILSHLMSFDSSLCIFLILYYTTTTTQLFLFAYPQLLVKYIILYSIALIIRFIALQFIVLEPPINLVPLYDPILLNTTYNGVVITKDLFFSGHLVSILCCYFVIPNRFLKRMFFILILTMTVLMYFQHIHYTIDYLAAYIIVFLGYKILYQKQYENSKSEYQYSEKLITV